MELIEELFMSLIRKSALSKGFNIKKTVYKIAIHDIFFYKCI